MEISTETRTAVVPALVTSMVFITLDPGMVTLTEMATAEEQTMETSMECQTLDHSMETKMAMVCEW